MFAVMLTTHVPAEMQIALWACMAMCIGLALHENGWLHYLRSKVVIAALGALLVALVLSRTAQACYYELNYYCSSFYGWFDIWCY